MTAPLNMLSLNRECSCFPIARDAVEQSVLSLSDNSEMEALLSKRTHYFASTPVFLSGETINAMTAQITAIEAEIKTEAFQLSVFDRSALAAFAPAKFTKGAFMGYDFHITEDGPKLIEINSNAGGAFIVNAIRKAVGQPIEQTELAFVEMFRREWQLGGYDGAPKTIAIIDENPAEQYHYPDMLLAASLLKRHGIEAVITDPGELTYDQSGLYKDGVKIDLVYNRLTDFDLAHESLAHIKQAWLDEAVVMTPDPRHHAAHADKRNMVYFSERLPFIPRTVEVNNASGESLWQDRKNYYFKPYAGFGSRAVYRGAKLTTGKWAEISKGGYVAQKLVKPPLRLLHDGDHELKFDVRVYTYDGEPLLTAARIYQGQVTNLRTQGGGLAPIIEIEAPVSACTRQACA